MGDDYDDNYDDGYGHDEQPQSGGAGKIVMIIVIVLGVVGGLCAVLAIIAAIAIPNLISARKNGNESAAIGALKAISNAEALFREGDKDQDDVLDYGTLDELSQANIVDPVLGGGVKQGYMFDVTVSPDKPEFEWWAIARPAVPGTTGDRYFYTNQTGVIWFSVDDIEDAQIDTTAPPLGVQVLGR